MNIVRWISFVLLLASVLIAKDLPLVAVLQVKVDKELRVKKLFTESEIEQLTVMIRSETSRILAGKSIVMSDANIKKMITTNMEECSGSSCFAGFLQTLQADYGIQPNLRLVYGELVLNLEVASSSNALGAPEFTSEPTEAGKKQLAKKAKELTREALSLMTTEMGIGTNPSDDRRREKDDDNSDEVGTVVTIEFTDGAAVVLVDNKVACTNKEKCSKELRKGKHNITVSRDGYRDSSFGINVPSGSNRYVLALQSKAGVLTLRASDAESEEDVVAQVVIDGSVVGITPWSGKVSMNARTIVLKADGYDDVEVRERAEEGKKRAVTGKMQAKPKAPKAGADMVAIPAGCFNMGSNDGDSDEKPVHRVCLSAFSMDKYEVTQGEYERVMGSNPSHFSSCGSNCPVEKVDWNESSDYCRKVGKRLPTEAEWEYAARAGTTTKWYCGNDESCVDRIAWNNGNSGSKTHPVGLKQPNAWGLYDMTGNVWEWTSDWYGNYGSSSQQDPSGASSGSARVDRGGSWYSHPTNLRSANRIFDEPGNRSGILGFRCVAP